MALWIPSRTTASLAMVALALGLATACGGEENGPTVEVEATESAPEERLDGTWPIAFATEESVADYGAKNGWVSLVMNRDVKKAASQLGPLGGTAAARAHSEVANVYRQAALLQAHSLIQTYGKTPEPTDPVGTAHLLTVSYVITGDLDKAREQSAKLGDADDPTQAWHGPWKTWLAGDATWPPDLSGLPLELPEVEAGAWPEAGKLPHYELPEQGSDAIRPMGDPGALVALALWHDGAADLAAPEQVAALSAMRAGYSLPIEPDVAAPPADIPMDLLFGNEMGSAADIAFLAALHGSEGIGAVDAHAGKSLLAWLAKQSQVDGVIDAERAVDVLAAYRADLIERAASKTGGETKAHQRKFIDIIYTGAFRGLALVAEVEGDREVSGILRINALDRSQKQTAWPVGLLALGAWDASNRYPTRAQEILHAQARRFPSLETARYGLDVMALRVSRERPGETPGM